MVWIWRVPIVVRFLDLSQSPRLCGQNQLLQREDEATWQILQGFTQMVVAGNQSNHKKQHADSWDVKTNATKWSCRGLFQDAKLENGLNLDCILRVKDWEDLCWFVLIFLTWRHVEGKPHSSLLIGVEPFQWDPGQWLQDKLLFIIFIFFRYWL